MLIHLQSQLKFSLEGKQTNKKLPSAAKQGRQGMKDEPLKGLIGQDK